LNAYTAFSGISRSIRADPPRHVAEVGELVVQLTLAVGRLAGQQGPNELVRV